MMDTIVIGGGQAGIVTSYFLQKQGVKHLVLEKDEAFSAWRNRWDNFKLNTANWMNGLPGMQEDFVAQKKWYDVATRQEALDVFDRYLKVVNPPIKEGVVVTAVVEEEDGWRVETKDEVYQAQHVVICTGYDSHGFVPDVAKKLPECVVQMHSSAYRNADQITTSNVLIVGSGSSGVQICEDLALNGHFEKIYFSVSDNGVVPWSVLGIPIGALSRLFPVFEIKRTSWLGKRIVKQWRGGDPAMAPSPRVLAKRYGVHLVGRVFDWEDAILCEDGQQVLADDLTVIWCTGFRHDFGFVRVKQSERVFDADGPIHERGVVQGVEGLFFVGLKFQYTVGSHLLRGVGRDAAYVAEKIAERTLWKG